MKNLPQLKEQPQYPDWWTEEWIQVAIQELDKRNLSATQLLRYEMTLAQNAAIVDAYNKKLEAAQQKGLELGKAEATKAAIVSLIRQNALSDAQIAQAFGVDIALVQAIKKELSKN